MIKIMYRHCNAMAVQIIRIFFLVSIANLAAFAIVFKPPNGKPFGC
ncbi:hypothetical protein [Ruminococcus sp.]|nr:hypothetical protein [Ruminococcus sp.]